MVVYWLLTFFDVMKLHLSMKAVITLHDPSMLCNLNSLFADVFLEDLTIIELVLLRFIESLFTSHHSLIFFYSELISVSKLFKSQADAKKLLSSANIL